MAGKETRGAGAADGGLFRGRTWVLVHEAAGAAAARVVAALVRALGARVKRMKAAEHDRTAAFLSHVPQLVSWALLEAARRDGVAAGHLDMAGPAFADMTRIAASPRALWREILAENAPEVRRALRAFAAALPVRRARPPR
jgi:prephenate dehydrogenase